MKLHGKSKTQLITLRLHNETQNHNNSKLSTSNISNSNPPPKKIHNTSTPLHTTNHITTAAQHMQDLDRNLITFKDSTALHTWVGRTS
ncbi:hypothetical protein Pmani_034143 [Petrolisthes manimaculis]|uniref:Uncharacterized protein n=1 Tax=Petrolisthes manimaculis TaxID=1843537 RepID=A0AAE1NN50_9EUCA|nr:hypothetical protein Pmani_034143 [Petrolisthes manimaculis]